jgi:hypothetical protein
MHMSAGHKTATSTLPPSPSAPLAPSRAPPAGPARKHHPPGWCSATPCRWRPEGGGRVGWWRKQQGRGSGAGKGHERPPGAQGRRGPLVCVKQGQVGPLAWARPCQLEGHGRAPQPVVAWPRACRRACASRPPAGSPSHKTPALRRVARAGGMVCACVKPFFESKNGARGPRQSGGASRARGAPACMAAHWTGTAARTRAARRWRPHPARPGRRRRLRRRCCRPRHSPARWQSRRPTRGRRSRVSAGRGRRPAPATRL